MKNILLLLLPLLVLNTLNITAQSKSAVRNMNTFCELMDQNYASFEEKGINWKEQCELYKNKISEQTPDSLLFRYMTEMLEPLNDAHVSLKAKSLNLTFSADRYSASIQEISSIPRGERRPMLKRMTATTLKEHNFETLQYIGPEFREEPLFSYSNNGTVGYLRFFRSFSHLYLMNGLFLNHQLNKIFSSFEQLEAVIVDVRFNMGGDDGFSHKVISSFMDSPQTFYSKQTRKQGEFGDLKPIVVKPSARRSFKGPLVLLTNDKTVSAADVLALMAYSLPQATIIGTRSNGSYSDLYNKTLPNGWKLSLSNQRYFTPDGSNFEGKGTPVGINAENKLHDFETSDDTVLRTALNYLEEGR